VNRDIDLRPEKRSLNFGGEYAFSTSPNVDNFVVVATRDDNFGLDPGVWMGTSNCILNQQGLCARKLAATGAEDNLPNHRGNLARDTLRGKPLASLQLGRAQRVFAKGGMLGHLRKTIQSSRNRIEKFCNMISDDRFGRSDLLAPKGERLLRDRTYGINVVEVHSFQFIHAGIDISWHSDIDDEEWAIHAFPQHGSEYLGRE
jgi:hypothetical protein